MDHPRRQRILLVFPGPLYDVREFLDARLATLADTFDGAVVTFAEQETSLTLSGFEVCAPQYRYGGGIGWRLRSTRMLFRAGMETARKAMARDGRGFDIVVSYDATKSGLVAWCLARSLKAKLVVELNGDLLSIENYATIRSVARRHLERGINYALATFVLSRANGIKLLYDQQLAPFRLVTRRTLTRRFPSFVDLSYFHDVGETNEVLLAGFPFRVKGVDLIIDAFRRVADRFPDWRLTIIGFYPDRTEIDRAMRGHPQMTLLPPVHRQEIAPRMGSCGIFVLPSRTEGMGRVLLEAAACGKLRIGSRVGGIPGVIEHETDGLLFDPENVDQLTALLERAMSDASLRRRLGDAARARADREFSESGWARSMKEFLTAVLAS